MVKKARQLASDLRPVFPEERLLLEILLDKKPNEFLENSVWVNDNRYYIDGESISLPNEIFQGADADVIAKKLEKYKSENTYQYFNQNIDKFIKANQNRLNYLKEESFEFIRNASSKFSEEKIVISFSGGKDSTVTADLVIKTLSNPSLVHIFGNTTLDSLLRLLMRNAIEKTIRRRFFYLPRMKSRYFWMCVRILARLPG